MNGQLHDMIDLSINFNQLVIKQSLSGIWNQTQFSEINYITNVDVKYYSTNYCVMGSHNYLIENTNTNTAFATHGLIDNAADFNIAIFINICNMTLTHIIWSFAIMTKISQTYVTQFEFESK